MKNLLDDFHIKNAFSTISDAKLDALLQAAGIDLSAVQDLRKSAKGKRKFHDQLGDLVGNHPEETILFCHRALRAAQFFRQHRRALRGLQQYAGLKVKELKILAADFESEAEYVVTLFINHQDVVREYFCISLFTEQSSRYHQWRQDYAETWPVLDAATFRKLETQLAECFNKDYGCPHYEMRTFEHDKKHFLLFDFEDLPAEKREFKDGQAIDRYTHPSLEVAFAFDSDKKAVEVVADNASMRLLMHRTCARTLYDRLDIPAQPPVNEWYRLDILFELLGSGQPILAENAEQSIVQKVFVNKLHLQRNQPPFWEKTLNIKCSKKSALDEERDASSEMPKMVKWDIDARPGSRHMWKKAAVDAIHADLFAVYYDEIEGKTLAKPFIINRDGGGNLTHSKEDEAIKQYLRAAGILRKQLPPLPSCLIPHVENPEEETVG